MKHLKIFEKFITEARDPKMERLARLGLTDGDFFTWKVEYDEDMQSNESSDKQEMYDYESSTGAHITKVEGVIEAFQTQLSIDISNGDKIQLHIKFAQHPGDKSNAAFQIMYGGGTYESPKWKMLFGHGYGQSDGKAEEWLEKVEDSGSSVQPVFYYYEEFLKTLNEGLNITTNEMIKPDIEEVKNNQIDETT